MLSAIYAGFICSMNWRKCSSVDKIRQNTTMQCWKVRSWQIFSSKQNPADCCICQFRWTHTFINHLLNKLENFSVQRNWWRNRIHSVFIRFSRTFCVWMNTEQSIVGNEEFTLPYPLYLIYVNYWRLFSIIMYKLDWCQVFPMTTYWNEWFWISMQINQMHVQYYYCCWLDNIHKTDLIAFDFIINELRIELGKNWKNMHLRWN